MGFFDKIKAIKNAVTGGAAEVGLDYDDFSFAQPITFTITAQTKDAPVKIDKVYLKIKAAEEVEVPDVDIEYDEEDGTTSRRVETIRASNETLDLEFVVDGAQELEANQSYEWEIEVELPDEAQPVFYGRFSQHTYMAFAGLDCFGNDPDSGWIELD